MSVHEILGVVGLVVGVGASGLMSIYSYSDEPLIGLILESGDSENEAIAARNKKRRLMQRIGFFGLTLSFILQLMGYIT